MRKLLIYSVMALLLEGCVIPSLHPLYTEEDLILDDDLFGIWQDEDNTWDFLLSNDRHRGQDHNAKTISLVCTSKGVPAEFDLHMVQLGKYYYLDFIAREYDIRNELLDFHLMPFHNFARVNIEAEEVRIEFFDPEWLESLLEDNKIRIEHEYMETHELYVLTASTRSLQKFIEKYGDDPNAYSDPIILKRI